MTRAPKLPFWAYEGVYYGRCAQYPTVESFLERIYAVTREEDEGHAFSEGWKRKHPLPQFIAEETPWVQRGWYRNSFMEGGGLGLEDGTPGKRGAFELWEWWRSRGP